ncbi:peroxisomal acyl-coenzyme A oxidase 1-like [Tubulanus polymorphus]|uniref:peroxisomal acyl-coenzyme A oxidase 1-like n=1 Tax=Tubulanus polymorphus TaxID=672921 RepID=UPI003DA4FC13
MADVRGLAPESEINKNLLLERKKATFNSIQLTHFLDGSKENTERRRHVESLALTDEVYKHKPVCFMSRDEAYDISVKKRTHAIQKLKQLDLTSPEDKYYYERIVAHRENSPFGLHFVMFLPTLMNQTTPEQQAKWLPKAMNCEILGTYAQTEMGHGTFLRGLETTATYDSNTEEFVLNSPTLTATKWWPGNLGKSSNHAIVLAQLYTRGECYGIHAFMLQTRRSDNHQPVPGVTLGDIGPKFGYNTNDNGFMSLNEVRIPRMNMLMKHAKVTKDGFYVKNDSGHSKSTYGTMVFIRSLLVSDIANALSEACTIAVRYSAVRQQSEITPGTEAQILDYKTQQYKLLPLVATSYTFFVVGRLMREMYFTIQERIENGEIDLVPELHALSAGLKAFTSDVITIGLETCRTSCGGHGYSWSSGFPKIYTDICPAVTYEGENTVMYLQTARYLVKCRGLALNGQKLTGSVAYISDNINQSCSISSTLNIHSLVDAFKHNAQREVIQMYDRLEHSKLEGNQSEIAWNMCSVQLVQGAKAHCQYFIVKTFADCLQQGDLEPSVKTILTKLFQLYGVYNIKERLGDFLQDGFMNSGQVETVVDGVLKLLDVLRPDAVALVDAFDFHDRVLDSVLGRYDGQVYKHLMTWAQNSSLNKTQVHPSFFKYIKPMFNKMSKL